MYRPSRVYQNSERKTALLVPQLAIEILSFEKGKSSLHELFGPKPLLWTLFLFLLFGIATLCIGFGIWSYTNLSLGKPYGMQLFMTGLMV